MNTKVCKDCKYLAVLYRNKGGMELYCNKNERSLNSQHLEGCINYESKRDRRYETLGTVRISEKP